MKYLLIFFTMLVLGLAATGCRDQVPYDTYSMQLENRTQNETSPFPKVLRTHSCSTTDDKLTQLAISHDEVRRFLQRTQQSIHSCLLVETDAGIDFLSVDLGRENLNNGLWVKNLIIYIVSPSEFVPVFMMHSTKPNGAMDIRWISTKNDQEIASFTYYTDDIPEDELPPCRLQTNNFNDCMNCVFKEVSNDWAFTATCMVLPHLCIAAATLHCAVGNKPLP